jgi:glycosyltransferase involved in cell wall biosynthesis
MGKIFEIGDSKGLAKAVNEVLQNQSAYRRMDPASFERYTPDAIAAAYEDLFAEIQLSL